MRRMVAIARSPIQQGGVMPSRQARQARQSGDDDQPRGQARGRRGQQDDADRQSSPDDRARGQQENEGERQAEATEQSGGDQGETEPQSPGVLARAGAALKGAVGIGQQVGDQAAALSPLGAASTAVGAALKETVTRLVNTLRELLQTVKGLLQTVVSLLRLILVALREGLMAAVLPLGRGLGSLVGEAAGDVTP